MKKNRLFVLGIITMFVAILSLTLVSGTMARYTSKVSGSDTATAAKWAFTVGDKSYGNGGVAYTEEFTLNLFDTLIDTMDDSAEGDVSAGVIAPGTKGSFVIGLANTSQVTANATVVITIEENAKGIPVILEGDKAATEGASYTFNVADLAKETGTATFEVNWEWAYGESVDDTIHGEQLSSIKVKVEVVFTQVD